MFALLLGTALVATGCKRDSDTAAAVASAWQEYDITDKMDARNKSFDAEAKLTADDGEGFDAKAACTPGFVNFTVTDYTKGAKIEVQQTQNGSDAFFLRTKLDSADVVSAHSDIEFNNEASIFFYDPDIAFRSIADGIAGNYGRALNTSGGSDAGNAVAAGAGVFAGMLAGPMLQLAAAGTIKDLRAANNLRIEVPMSDGRKPMLTIALRDPALQEFFGRCQRHSEKQYPPAPVQADAPAPDAAPSEVATASPASGPSPSPEQNPAPPSPAQQDGTSPASADATAGQPPTGNQN
jgi:hypothetical protein